jgi:hypothetical protein
MWAPYLAWQAKHGPELTVARSIANGGFRDIGPTLANPAGTPSCAGAVRSASPTLSSPSRSSSPGGKPYYLAGMFPLLLAVGARPVLRWVRHGRPRARRALLIAAVALREDQDQGVIGRWCRQDSDLILDAMPSDPTLLGFENRWQGASIPHAVECALPSGSTIRAAPPAYLLATASLTQACGTGREPKPAGRRPGPSRRALGASARLSGRGCCCRAASARPGRRRR